MIIDAHVHITDNGKWFDTSHDASLERLMDEMDESGIDKCLLISMPFAATNKYIASIVEKYPEKFRGIGCIDFSGKILKQIDEILAMGLSGIKIHPRIQGVNICDANFDFLWEYLDKGKMKILVDGYYQVSNNKLLTRDLFPLAYEGHIKKYKNVAFILAHAGSHKVMDTYFLCRSNQNFYCDISYSINVFKETSFYKDYKFLMNNVDKKVLFGSDFPGINILSAKKNYLDLAKNFSADKFNNIIGLNAYSLFWGDKK